MAKILPIESEGRPTGWIFFCPACGCGHKFCTADAHTQDWPVWTLTGMPDAPTVRASVKYEFEQDGRQVLCHSFITNGNIEYCADCTHDLSGKTVPIPEFPGNYDL